MNIYFTGVGPRLKDLINQQNSQNWAVDIKYRESPQEDVVNSQYLDLVEELPRDNLVYLTADSENVLEELDPTQIYIIGGIVDHNRHKLLTFDKAFCQKIRHARLPIRESGVQLTTSCVLTVNHVMDIIARYLTKGGGKNMETWREALEEAIPERKRIGVYYTKEKRGAGEAGSSSEVEEDDH